MKKFKKILNDIFCVALAAIVSTVSIVSAYAGNSQSSTKYVKDIVLVYGESLSDAKKNTPSGYTVLENNLNKGTDSDNNVYIAFATTDDPDEAITDIKAMNMNGGFEFSDYNDRLESINENVNKMKEELIVAVAAFIDNYNAGTYGAKSAYEALSVFRVDEADVSLADYLIYGDVPDSFYVKLLLNAHINVLSAILSALSMAVQTEGNTWLQRLSEVQDPYSVTNSLYWDKAVDLHPQFVEFYEIYSSIDHDMYRIGQGPITVTTNNDENDLGIDISVGGNESSGDNTGSEILYEISYNTMDTYSFGDGTKVSEWLINDYLYEEMLYALISVLTPAEYAMMHLAGPLFMVLGTAVDEETYLDYTNRISEIKEDTPPISIWYGVDTNLFLSSIAITDKAGRALSETKAEQELLSDGDSTNDAIIRAAGLITAAGAVALGVGLVAFAFGGASFATIFTGVYASTFAIVMSIMAPFAIAAGIIILAVALVVAIVWLVFLIIDWYDETHPEFTEIPEYMYDVVIDSSQNQQFVLYEAVKDPDGNCADLNAMEGRQWHVPYISRDKSAGNPIKADFVVKYGDGRVDDGYMPLAAFGKVVCENLNGYAFDDDVDGIYVSYRQENQTGEFAKGKYLSDMKLFSNENKDVCLLELRKENYTAYEINLTPDSDVYTFIGYKTTDNEVLALTDIRLAYNYNVSMYSAGGMGDTYANSGCAGELTLFTTRISLFGSPILSDIIVLDNLDAPEGYEPVNTFSGGPAINMNGDPGDANKKYLFFLPSITYTSGEEYLGGIATMFAYPNYGGAADKFSNELGFEVLKKVSGNYSADGMILFTTTYNPYRAIYGITALSNKNEMGDKFQETIYYDGIGYSIASRFMAGESAAFDMSDRGSDSRLYVSGIRVGASPIKASDIYATDVDSAPQAGFVPVRSCFSETGRPANLSDAFDGWQRVGRNNRLLVMPELYLYTRGTEYEEHKYITNIYVSSKEQVLAGLDYSYDSIDNSYVMNNLMAQGAHSLIRKNLNLAESENSTYIGYTKNDDMGENITNLILFYEGESNRGPSNTITKNNITYYLAGKVNLFCEENGDDAVSDRVYLYYTSNPAAGSPIIDIKIDNTAILNGWYTVRTQNDRALYDEMDNYSGSMWFIHVKREKTLPKYISEIYIGWGNEMEAYAMLIAAGCEYMIHKDLNDNCGAATDYVYLGYKRTNNANEAIRDLRTIHDDDVDSFTVGSAKYTKIAGNLNSYTYLWSDDIFLYYSKDVYAGNPIVSLDTKSDPYESTDGVLQTTTVVNQDDDPSDLNDGAGGDYIYLIQTKDNSITGAISSMLGEGSVIAFISLTLISVATVVVILMVQKRRFLEEKFATTSTIDN